MMTGHSPFLIYICCIYLVYGQTIPCVNPATNCATEVPGEEVPNPENCQSYYICLADGGVTAVPTTCPNGGYFDNTIADPTCDETLTYCPFSCSSGNETHCPIACNGDGYAVDPTDCNKYFVCTPGTTFSQSCGTGLYFDILSSKCVTDSSVCCPERCSNPCEGIEGTREVPDPVACGSFFVCSDEAVISYGICASGQNFSGPLEICTDTVDCLIYCQSSLTTLTSTVDPNCQESIICLEEGSFAKCDICVSEYFVCLEQGEPGVETACAEDFLFDPNKRLCVPKEDCNSLIVSTTTAPIISTTPTPL